MGAKKTTDYNIHVRENLEQTIAEAQGRKIDFPVRTFNTDQYYHSALNPYPKRYYYQMRGIRVVEKYRFGYKAAKYYKDIMLLQKLQEEYLFLYDNHIHSFEDLLDYRSNAVDELNQIRSEQQEIYARNASLKRKCDTPEGMREYQAEHLKNGQRLDELKKRARQLRKGKSLSERQMAASINEALERIGRDYPAESLEIDPSISDVPEYPVAVARLKAEKERREAEARAKVERERQEAEARVTEERRKAREQEEAARRREVERAEAEKRKAEEAKRVKGQARKEHLDNLHKKMQSEGERLVNASYEFPFDKPYKWDYIHYINDIRFKSVSLLTEAEMTEPFLTYEQFVEEKKRDIPQSFIVQTEQSRIHESNSEQSVSPQVESPILPTEGIVSIPKPSAAKPMKKTSAVTKQDYDRMTNKEKADWVGIDIKDFSGSINRFTQKMKLIGITYRSIPEMSDDFMKLYNAMEKVLNTPDGSRDYQRVLRR